MNKQTALILACTLALAVSAGCAKSGSDTTTTSSTTAGPVTDAASSGLKSEASAPVQKVAAGDAVHGKAIFTQNCSGCHGASGVEGGVGPSLKNEKSRKDTAAAIAWIENPKAPMPKLYPSPLSGQDVADVAAYVESL